MPYLHYLTIGHYGGYYVFKKDFKTYVRAKDIFYALDYKRYNYKPLMRFDIKSASSFGITGIISHNSKFVEIDDMILIIHTKLRKCMNLEVKNKILYHLECIKIMMKYMSLMYSTEPISLELLRLNITDMLTLDLYKKHSNQIQLTTNDNSPISTPDNRHTNPVWNILTELCILNKKHKDQLPRTNTKDCPILNKSSILEVQKECIQTTNSSFH